MGKSRVCNYEIQILNPATGDLHLLGAMRYQEAKAKLLERARELRSQVGFIWPQTKMASKKLANIPWVTNRYGVDYLKFTIEVNTPERKVYCISGRSVCDKED